MFLWCGAARAAAGDPSLPYRDPAPRRARPIGTPRRAQRPPRESPRRPRRGPPPRRLAFDSRGGGGHGEWISGARASPPPPPWPLPAARCRRRRVAAPRTTRALAMPSPVAPAASPARPPASPLRGAPLGAGAEREGGVAPPTGRRAAVRGLRYGGFLFFSCAVFTPVRVGFHYSAARGRRSRSTLAARWQRGRWACAAAAAASTASHSSRSSASPAPGRAKRSRPAPRSRRGRIAPCQLSRRAPDGIAPAAQGAGRRAQGARRRAQGAGRRAQGAG